MVFVDMATPHSSFLDLLADLCPLRHLTPKLEVGLRQGWEIGQKPVRRGPTLADLVRAVWEEKLKWPIQKKKKGSVSEYQLSITLWSPVTTGNLTSCRHLSHLFYRKKKKTGSNSKRQWALGAGPRLPYLGLGRIWLTENRRLSSSSALLHE